MTTVLRTLPIRAWARLATTALALLGLSAAPAAAHIIYGLTTGGMVFTVDTNAPGVGLQIGAIRGLQPGETALAIDLRPATGQIFLLGSTSRLYVLDPSGQLRFVSGPFTPAVAGTVVGFDFNPTSDRIRIVTDTGQNLRVDPDSGGATVDTPLNPGTPRIVGSAYANNHAGSAATTLYAIDSATDRLLIQNPPNAGTLTLVGNLGVDTSDDVGFDISANDGIAFATLTVGGTSRLYTIDLATGAATVIAPVFGGSWRDFTVLSRGVPMLALRNGTELARFHSATPGTLLGQVTIAGLQAGESIVGIDVRPSNGQLYGVGSTSRVYLIDAVTGSAKAVGAPFAPALAGTRFGVDVDPVDDRLRVVSDAEQNLRIDLDTGVATAGSALAPASAVGGAAYANPFDGTQFTTLYALDTQTDLVSIQDPADDGTLTTVGPLGVNAGPDLGFDISPLDGVAFAALSVGGVSGLYTVNLTTGAARLIGPIGSGAAVTGLAILPVAYQLAEGSTGAFFDTDILLANPTTSAVPVTVIYQTELANVVAHSVTLAPQSRLTIAADANPALGATAFSSTVVSHLGIPIVVERTMRWDATGYGMHTEKAASSLARTWFFAEGSQGFYDTYFLLTNPTTVANAVQLRFLLENGTEVVRDYPMLGESRLTVYAGEIPELVNQAFGTVATFAFAGAAERAMYFGSPLFSGGHESAGVTRTSTEWFLAEGATGSFFTTFVLLSNPNATPAAVTMTYLREGGGTVTRSKTVPAGTRLTINLGLEDPTLAATSVAARITSTVGIIAERAMYWPFSPVSWQEAHSAFGVTETALRWGLAEGRVGGPEAYQTFVLVANPGSTVANLTLTFLRTTGAPITKTATVPAGGRRTITTGPASMVPELADESFGVVVASDQPVFAERALYANANGVFWAAGSAATATALP
ncbi:MAG: DUF4394 domain-containing protein [Vicinamibacteraceae bacterium]